MSRRQLTLLAQVSASSARPAITQLIASGLILETPAGSATLVSLNREHLAYPHLAALAALRSELVRRLRHELDNWPGLTGAWLFGSTARGEAGPSSDIDLLLILDDPESAEVHRRMEQLHSRLQKWTGNEIQVVEHTPKTWQQLVRTGNDLVQEVRADGIALIHNDPSHLKRTRNDDPR